MACSSRPVARPDSVPVSLPQEDPTFLKPVAVPQAHVGGDARDDFNVCRGVVQTANKRISSTKDWLASVRKSANVP